MNEPAHAPSERSLGPLLRPVVTLRPGKRHGLGPNTDLVLALALVLAVMAIGNIRGYRREAWIAFGGVLLVAGMTFRQERRKLGTVATLELREHGLEVRQKGEVHRFLYSDLPALTVWERPEIRNGRELGLERRLTVKGAATEVTVVQFVATGTQDVLEPALAPLFDALADAAEARIQAGGSLRGDDWVLDGWGLHSPPANVPYAELSALQVTSHGVALYRSQESEPFLCLAIDGANVDVLVRLVRRRLPQKAQARSAPVTGNVRAAPSLPSGSRGSDAGRRIFFRVRGWMLCSAMLLFGLWACVFAWSTKDLQLVDRFIYQAGAVLLLLGAWWNQPGKLLVFERAVRLERWLARDVTIALEEVAQVGFAQIGIDSNGAALGTDCLFELRTEDGRKLRFRRMAGTSDAELAAFVEHLSARIAGKMLAKLEAGGEVPWGKAFLSRDGLRVSRSSKERIPLDTLWIEEKEHHIPVLRVGKRKVMRLRVERLNHYPCLMVFQELKRANGGVRPQPS